MYIYIHIVQYNIYIYNRSYRTIHPLPPTGTQPLGNSALFAPMVSSCAADPTAVMHWPPEGCGDPLPCHSTQKDLSGLADVWQFGSALAQWMSSHFSSPSKRWVSCRVRCSTTGARILTSSLRASQTWHAGVAGDAKRRAAEVEDQRGASDAAEEDLGHRDVHGVHLVARQLLTGEERTVRS